MTHTCWDMISYKSKGQKQVDPFIALKTIEPSQSMHSFSAVEQKNPNN